MSCTELISAAISRQNHGKVKRVNVIFEDVPEQIEVLNHRGKNLTTKRAREKEI
jgi:hypothetical protein